MACWRHWRFQLELLIEHPSQPDDEAEPPQADDDEAEPPQSEAQLVLGDGGRIGV